ncbi:hypothetical protein B0H17DRAFT_932497 [Mycena rosella]|uniref:RRM domain-containing protein n=1 Tax=Mycena rosella TaxID=1033263 RepID=A0AAD7GJK8_MYCRO|nr:hypothetical protein B0H17DRAFT_932497 [Mycena rosella]
MSSSSSSSSSSRSSTPEPTKRKRDAEDSDSDSDSDSSDDSEVEGAADPDVPVLSHAEQRRQKRKEKQEKSDQPAKKRKLPDGSAAAAGAPSKRQNSVWVGNLTFKTTTEALTEFFKDAGEITRIHMPTKASTAPGVKAENRGYAYVDFTTEEGKKAAIALSEQNLFGRRLLIKDGGDFTGRPALPGAEAAAANGTEPPKTHSKTAQKILRAQKQPPAPTLFLGNLGFETTDQSIRELFDAHRPIKKKAKTEDGAEEEKPEADKEKWIRKVRMGTFEDSGLCKGFAFVDFTSIEHATSVLVNTKNHMLNGRKLVVEYASADAVRRGAPKVKREEGGADRVPQRRKEAKSRGPRAEKKLEREHKAGDAPTSTFGPPRAGGRPSYDKTSTPHASRDAESGGGARERKGPKNRPKPGAALALAKRESAAIVPSQGKKVVF